MRNRLTKWTTRLFALAGAVLGVSAPMVIAPSTIAEPNDKKTQVSADEEDVLVLKGTNIEVRGKILEETETKIKFRGTMSGIAFEKEYDRADIASIRRGKPASAQPEAPKPAPGSNASVLPPKPSVPASAVDDSQTKRVYVMDLKGEFGVDITQTPIRDAVKDAQANKADVIICVLDAVYRSRQGEKMDAKDVDTFRPGVFDQIFRAEFITPIFIEEMPRDWREKMPKVVFWVKNAMGGAAILPFISNEMYMHSEARIGGIGFLTNMFDGVGDAVVQHKQYSLRIGHARGWTIAGGYNPDLINALAVGPYVLSCKIEGDRIDYFERLPDPLKGEILLTDDGAGANRDTMIDVVRGEGNDCLTLSAKLARDLRVSKATVDTMDDLMFQLGLERTGKVIPGKSKVIMDSWSKGLADNQKRVLTLIEEAFRAPPPRARTGQQMTEQQAQDDLIKQLSTRKAKLEQALGILKGKYSESITDLWRGMNGVPANETIQGAIDQIKQQIMDLRSR